MLDLKLLEKKLDAALRKESAESLKNWLKAERRAEKNKKIQIGKQH